MQVFVVCLHFEVGGVETPCQSVYYVVYFTFLNQLYHTYLLSEQILRIALTETALLCILCFKSKPPSADTKCIKTS